MSRFYEYLAKQKGVGLPDPVTMLAKLGISPDIPHEIDVMRMVKQMKKAAGTKTNMTPSAASRTERLPQPIPESVCKRAPISHAGARGSECENINE